MEYYPNIDNVSIISLDDIVLLLIKNNDYIHIENIIRNHNVPENFYKNKFFSNKINIDIGLLFRNRFDENFRHFLIETFSIINLFDNINCKILIPINTPKHNLELLELYEVLDRVIIIDSNTEVICNKIVLPKVGIYIDNIFINKCLSKSNININFNKNIYLNREKYDIDKKRYVTNYDEFKDLIQENYEFIELDNYKFYEQVAIINNALKVVTLIGAGCENILFINKNCTFTIIYPDFCKKWENIYRFEYSNIIEGEYNSICCGERDYLYPSINDDPVNKPYKLYIDIIKDKLLL